MKTRIKLSGPANESPAAVMLDMTPTWGAIMPALLAALQDGTGEGKRIARAELLRLAGEIDALNAREPQPGPDGEPLADTLESWAKANLEDSRNASARGAVMSDARASAFYHAAAHVAGTETTNGGRLSRLAGDCYGAAVTGRNNAHDTTRRAIRARDALAPLWDGTQSRLADGVTFPAVTVAVESAFAFLSQVSGDI
jgi:hypothetical protein